MANEMDMGRGWLVACGGQEFGPYTWEQLVEAARQGRIAPEDLVWHPSVSDWEPAPEVPGLLSTAEAPAGQAEYTTTSAGMYTAGIPDLSAPAPAAYVSRRRRTRIVVASVVVVVVVALAATLSVVLTRNRGGGQDLVLHEIQDMTVWGTVTLPPGASLAPSDLRVLSNRADTTVAGDGAFSLTAASFPAAETLVVAVGPGGNPLLMGAGSAAGQTSVSALSTARALVLYDPAIIGLPSEMAAEAERLATSGPGLAELATMVEESMRADPEDPLNADTHPELYQKAARLTADALAPLMEVQPQAADYFPAARGPRLPASNVLLVADTSGGFVAVQDDPDHATPDVVLVNHTFAYYDVEWVRRLVANTTTGRAVLPRCRPYNVEKLRMQLMPVAFVKTRVLPLGDGRLSFSFKKNVKLTGFDAGIVLVGTLAGFGAARAGLLDTAGEGLPAALDASIKGSRAIMEFIQLFDRNSGTLTYAEALKETGGFLAVNGYRFTVAMLQLVAPERMSEEYIKIVGLTIAKKPLQLALLGYGSLDVAGMMVDGRNPALDSYSTGGVQLAGIYPFEATMTAEFLGQRDGAYLFQATIGSLPRDFTQQLQLLFSYGDHKKDAVTPNVEAGGVPVAVSHRYQKGGSYQVKVELSTTGKDRFVLASQTIPLDVEVAGDSGSVGDPLAAPFPNGFVQAGGSRDSADGWTFQGVELQRKGTVEVNFIKYPEGYTRNPLANVNEEDFIVAHGSMPCVYVGLVTIITSQSALTSWGGPVMRVVDPRDATWDYWTFRHSPLNDMVFDPQRNLYYSPPGIGHSGSSALLRAGDRLVMVDCDYNYEDEVISNYQMPDGANAFSETAGQGTVGADTQALIRWIQERLAKQ